MRFLARFFFAFFWLLALAGMVVADGGWFALWSVLFVVVPFIYVPLLEELE